MTLPAIAVVGGTGNLGAAIAWRLARAGYPVTIGSRNAESAEKAAAELGHGLRGGANVDVVANADIIIVTVPFAAQRRHFATSHRMLLASWSWIRPFPSSRPR